MKRRVELFKRRRGPVVGQPTRPEACGLRLFAWNGAANGDGGHEKERCESVRNPSVPVSPPTGSVTVSIGSAICSAPTGRPNWGKRDSIQDSLSTICPAETQIRQFLHNPTLMSGWNPCQRWWLCWRGHYGSAGWRSLTETFPRFELLASDWLRRLAIRGVPRNHNRL